MRLLRPVFCRLVFCRPVFCRLVFSPLVFFLCLLVPFAAHAAETRAEHAANAYAAQEMASHPVNGNLPDYSLSPADLAKAQHLSTVGTVLTLAGTLWSIVQLLLLLGLGGIAWMRDRAVGVGRNRWAQGYVFLLLFLVAGFLLDLPLSLYSQHLSRVYGLSVQGWGSWLGDEAKGFALSWVFGGLLLMLLFWVIRKFPRRWWVVFWVFSLPITIFALFASPYAGFLFNKYEPLAAHNPELVKRLGEVVDKGHMGIPPERMYLRKASAKVTTMNADVEGFGSTKRVVVWDTTVARMTPDEVTGVFGHESGHYVLGHIRSGAVVSFLIVFATLFLTFIFVRWALRRFGPAWRIPSQQDWGTTAVIVLAFSLIGVVLGPLTNTLTRINEHAADVYGQEAIHGIVPDPQAAMQGAFQKLGTGSFAVPNPPLLKEFWFGSHPAIGRRAAFAHVYDPWAAGMEPKYFKKQ